MTTIASSHPATTPHWHWLIAGAASLALLITAYAPESTLAEPVPDRHSVHMRDHDRTWAPAASLGRNEARHGGALRRHGNADNPSGSAGRNVPR